MSQKYVVYCETEGLYVEGWSDLTPTTCFHDDTHTITSSKTKPLLTPYMRLTQTDDVSTVGGAPNLYIHPLFDTVEPLTTKDIVLPIEIDQNIFSIQLEFTKASFGDCFSLWLNKDTAIGTFTAAATEATTLNVSDSVLLYAKKGFFITTPGAGLYRRVLDVDTEDKTLTINGPLTVLNADIVQLTYFVVYDWNISKTVYTFGTNIIGSTHLAAGNQSGLTYSNKTNSAKRINLSIETTF